MDQEGLTTRTRDCQAALLAALETDYPLWASQEPIQFADEPLGKLRIAPARWGAACLIIQPPLSLPEQQLLQGMKQVLPAEIGEIPCVNLSPYLQYERLIRYLRFWRPRSLWLLGETCARVVLRSDDSVSEFRAKQPLTINLHPQEPIPVLVTEHPRHLIDHIPGKRQAYEDLLALKFRMTSWF